MIEVTKAVEWDMGHRVPNHKNKCRNPHGHRYRLEVTLRGEVIQTAGSSSEGMVFDFGDMKQLMLTHVHDVLDHGFMIYEKDRILLDMFESQKEQFKLIVVSFVPTAEKLAYWCFQQLKDNIPSSIVISRCRVFETPSSFADYYP